MGSLFCQTSSEKLKSTERAAIYSLDFLHQMGKQARRKKRGARLRQEMSCPEGQGSDSRFDDVASMT
jgi:hypothetical protein